MVFLLFFLLLLTTVSGKLRRALILAFHKSLQLCLFFHNKVDKSIFPEL